ncbi:ABC transporter permease [Sphingobacterium alkalisoli]|uniref:ABC transporter permease n=2 Tax=Sphingobacterium alkalisoli TaxID=1874115 RepID=A0A4U0HA33_9SPHI|nr:ABC transporter permease [Sphingobacterium alkalisoli]TJY68254.1 ABC transporter permease [Sphingobacterium alkalisoli]GGH07824.1 flexirubin biosynthesis protein [Sphingobacterium alkalisoli]
MIEIQAFLPHRRPMLMVDHIVEISADHVICHFLIQRDNVLLRDGFFQEIGLVENMAQVCSSIVGQTYYEDDYNAAVDERAIGFISGIKSLRILVLPQVGDLLVTDATLTSKFDGNDYSICTMQVSSRIGERICAEADINLFLKKENK